MQALEAESSDDEDEGFSSSEGEDEHEENDDADEDEDDDEEADEDDDVGSDSNLVQGEEEQDKVDGQERKDVMRSRLHKTRRLLKQRKLDIIALQDSLLTLLLWHAALPVKFVIACIDALGMNAMEILHAPCPCTSIILSG